MTARLGDGPRLGAPTTPPTTTATTGFDPRLGSSPGRGPSGPGQSPADEAVHLAVVRTEAEARQYASTLPGNPTIEPLDHNGVPGFVVRLTGQWAAFVNRLLIDGAPEGSWEEAYRLTGEEAAAMMTDEPPEP